MSFLQVPAPSQELVPEQVGELFVSSEYFATLVVHAPDAFAHDLHWVVQVDEQQVPSTQYPEVHARQLATLQSAPAARLQLVPLFLRAVQTPVALQ